jgi:hypothetical protein
MRLRIVLAVVALGVCAQAEELTDATFAKFRAFIMPTQAEQQFMTIPWYPTFWQAVLDANKREAPILLWVMNGHPLTCT